MRREQAQAIRSVMITIVMIVVIVVIIRAIKTRSLLPVNKVNQSDCFQPSMRRQHRPSGQ